MDDAARPTIDEPTRQRIATRVARLEQQIRAFKELHATELGQILDELASLRRDLETMKAAPDAAPLADPAAASPKRAQWQEEEARRTQERDAPLSRRELLRGRDP